MKTINEVSDEDRLVVLRWVFDQIKQSDDDPTMMLFNTINRMEKRLAQPTQGKESGTTDAYVTNDECCSNCGSKLANTAGAEKARLEWQTEAANAQRELTSAQQRITELEEGVPPTDWVRKDEFRRTTDFISWLTAYCSVSIDFDKDRIFQKATNELQRLETLLAEKPKEEK